MDNRRPKNMQELLRFAIKQQQNEINECVEIDEDKRIFLNKVLQSMTVDVIGELLKAIQILQDDSSSEEDMVNALDLIRDYIDNIDFANSFVKIEGADTLMNCVKSENKTVSMNAINIVAEMCQNNKFCQHHFLKYEIIEHLIKCLTNKDAELVASALYALSGLIRNYEPALMEFLKKDGLKNLTNCLNSDSTRVFTKCCFLLTAISSEFSLVKDECGKLGMLKTLFKKLRTVNGYDVELEMTLNTISVLLESRYCKLNEDENKHIVNILNSIVAQNGHLPECEEIVSQSNAILQELRSIDEINDQKV